MKHKILFLVLLLMFIFSWSENALAQIPISLGVRGGLNFASESVSDLNVTVDVSSRTVFGFGGVAEMGIFDFIYLQTEPRYIQKGAKISSPFFGQTLISTIKLDYFEIPISIKAKFDAGSVQPYFFAGPTLSFLLSAKAELEVQGQKQTGDIKDNTESTEFSLDFGAGIAHEIATKISITGDVRYTLGLSKINKSSNPNDKSTFKSKDIKIFVGLLYSL